MNLHLFFNHIVKKQRDDARQWFKAYAEVIAIALVISCLFAGLFFKNIVLFIGYICLVMLVVLCMF